MKNEVNVAVEFISKLIENSKISENDRQKFQQSLRISLLQKFKNHWHPSKPWKGQGYRCLRVNGNNGKEATIDRAASASGLNYADLNLPLELTVWVDPNEVSCRFGEHGSCCTVASFKDGFQTFNILPKSNEDGSSRIYTHKQVLRKESSETSASEKEEKNLTSFLDYEKSMSNSQGESLTLDKKGDHHIFTKTTSPFPQLKEASVESLEPFPLFRGKNILSISSKSSSFIGNTCSVTPPLHSNAFVNSKTPASYFSSRENLNFHCMSPVNISKFLSNSDHYPVSSNQRNAWYASRRVATV